MMSMALRLTRHKRLSPKPYQASFVPIPLGAGLSERRPTSGSVFLRMTWKAGKIVLHVMKGAT